MLKTCHQKYRNILSSCQTWKNNKKYKIKLAVSFICYLYVYLYRLLSVYLYRLSCLLAFLQTTEQKNIRRLLLYLMFLLSSWLRYRKQSYTRKRLDCSLMRALKLLNSCNTELVN